MKITVSLWMLFMAVGTLMAFPPAPPHTIYGMVRDQYGEPLTRTVDQIVFEPLQGAKVVERIVPNLRPGVNYQLSIPMDAMKGTELYLDNALTALVSFRIKVITGAITNLPMEMAISSTNQLGNPSESTRIDLTLGADSDRDGLPDAWEQLLLDVFGGLNLADITPTGDSDGDGISNWNEYIAGTYADDPEEGFTLALKEAKPDRVILEFLAIKGRTYEIKRSTDLKTWEKVKFRVPAKNSDLRSSYSTSSAFDVGRLQIEITNAVSETAHYFYRGFVQ